MKHFSQLLINVCTSLWLVTPCLQADSEASPQSGGYDVELFVDTPDYDLICTICQGVLRCPVRATCHHIFCKRCILQWLKRYRPRWPMGIITSFTLHSFWGRGSAVVGLLDSQTKVSGFEPECPLQLLTCLRAVGLPEKEALTPQCLLMT